MPSLLKKVLKFINKTRVHIHNYFPFIPFIKIVWNSLSKEWMTQREFETKITLL